MLHAITIVLVAFLQTAPPQGGGQQPRRPTVQNHPKDFDVLVHRRSADGTTTQVATFARAGVPTIITLDNDELLAAHQWFPEEDDAAHFDEVAVRRSTDGGLTWSDPVAIEVDGLPEGSRFPFDPTLTRTADGRIRLFFTWMKGRTFNQFTPQIHSAISSDGVHFTYEPGARFQVEGKPTIDCSVGRVGNRWVLICPHHDGGLQAGAYLATSRDGLTFTRQDDLPSIGSGKRWLGCLLEEGRNLRFFGTAGAPGPDASAGQPKSGGRGEPSEGRRGRRRGDDRGSGGQGGGQGQSGEGGAERPSRENIWTARMNTSGRGQEHDAYSVPGADPGVAVLSDGTLVFVTTGPPRDGTDSAKQREQHRREQRERRGGPSSGQPPSRP